MNLVTWLTAFITGADAPPTRDMAHGPIRGTFRRERRRAHVAIQRGGFTQFNEHDVAVLCAGGCSLGGEWILQTWCAVQGPRAPRCRAHPAAPRHWIWMRHIKCHEYSCVEAHDLKGTGYGDLLSHFVLQWAAESTHCGDRRTPPQKLYPVKRDTW